MTHLYFARFYGVLMITANAPILVSAASFDCQSAKSPIEHAICANPPLSNADQRMSAAYATAQSSLSSNGRALIRDSQRSFLHYAQKLCRPGSRPLDDGNRPAANTPQATDQEAVAVCLTKAFQERTEKLSSSIHRVAGQLFVSTATYDIRPTTYESGADILPGTDTQVLTLLQMDNPTSDSERIWNDRMRRWLLATDKWPPAAGHDANFKQDNEDLVAGEELAGTSPELISVVFTNWGYEKGSPHGDSVSATSNWLLQSGRELTATDLFKAGKDWKTKLLPIAQRHLQMNQGAGPGQIVDVERVDRWQIDRDGIVIEFEPYALGAYGTGYTTIPWGEIKPLLNPAMPFRPSLMRSESSR